MFEHAREHATLHRALSGTRGGTIALETIRRMLSDLVRNELRARRGKGCTDDLPRELVVQHIVGAYMAVLIWWLDGATRLTPEQVDTMFRRLMLQGLTPSAS